MAECGGCTACCTVLGVKSLNKSDFSPCDHCTGKGCGIYSIRPKECQTYQCLWLIGNGIPEHRREIVPGASENDYVRAFVGTVAQKFGALIYVVREDGTRSAFFPPWAARYASYAKQLSANLSTKKVDQKRVREKKRRTKRKNRLSQLSRRRNRQ